jgi:O-antigen/teichoic acid export membrane protein
MRDELARLSKTILIYGVGGAVTRIISFLFLPVFTAYLTPADYGVTSMLAWMTSFIVPFFSLGLGTAIAPCYFEGNEVGRKDAAVWTAFALLASSTMLLITVGVGLAPTLSRIAFRTEAYRYLVILSLCSIGPSLLSIPLMLELQFKQRATAFVGLTLAATLVSVGLSILTVVAMGRGVQGVLEAGLMTQVITLGLFLWPVLAATRLRLDLKLCKELLRIGLPLIPTSLSLFMLQVGNRYILERSAGLTTVGIYTVGYNLGMAMSLFVSAFQSAWMPYFMSYMHKRGEAQEVLGRMLTYYTFGFGLVSLLFFVLAKPVVMVMVQPPFREAYRVVGLSAAAFFLAGAQCILLPSMYFAKELWPASIIQAVAAAVSIGANLILIPALGLLGAGVGLVLGFVGLFACTHLWNLYRRGTYLAVRYEWNRVGAFMLVYCAYAVGMLWNRNLSLAGEIALSFIAVMLLPPLLYVLMTGPERVVIWQSCRRLKTETQSRPSTNISLVP